MNSTLNNWQKNIALLKSNFNDLYNFLKEDIDSTTLCLEQAKKLCPAATPLEENLFILNKVFPFWKFSTAKTQAVTAAIPGENRDIQIHSAYDPEKEAVRTVSQAKSAPANVFAGIGLGYTVNLFAETVKEKNKDSVIVIVEPDAGFLFAAFCACDFHSVLTSNAIIITKAMPHDAVTVLDSLNLLADKKDFQLITQQSFTSHQELWFREFKELVDRNLQKNAINQSTKEKFGKLWIKNACRNLSCYTEFDGLSIYQNKLSPDVPVIVVAAGPSLQDILPHLKALKDRALIVAVDTALKALLRAGVEPDFIVLLDPQYYAACHIQGLKSPSSVLIAESAVYPSVFRFECRKTVLASSLFPFGKFIESKTGSKGELKTGGSVSTSAWDFARITGSKKIFMAGLDLGYPDKTTHVKGSTFEEKSHSASKRTSPSQNNISNILFSAQNQDDRNYLNEKLITDSKMKLFAWWFESQCAAFPQVQTFTLSPKGLFIPGINCFSIEDFLKFPVIEKEKKEFFECENTSSNKVEKNLFKSVITDFKENLLTLKADARKGIRLCQKVLELPYSLALKEASGVFSALNEIDSRILKSQAKDTAELVFPSKSRLEKLTGELDLSSEPAIQSLQKSLLVYTELENSLNQYLKNL